MDILIYLLIGAVAGFSAGLFGIGGGLIIVPILYWTFSQQGYAPEYMMHMCLGTSLATIILTSISSIMAHHKKAAVLWQVVRHFSPGLVLGAFFGAFLADLMPNQVLQLITALFAYWVAYRMLRTANLVVDTTKQLPSVWQQSLVGAVIGIVAAIFGIGGGSLTVPYLNRFGVVMQKAVATSAACGLPIAVAGALGFMWFGSNSAVPIKGAIGYVHLYAFLGISLMSVLTAKFGAKLAHQLPAALLKKCFALYLLLVGSYFFYKALSYYL